MKRHPPQDFYEIQRRQWKRSLLVLAALALFYFLAIGLIALAVLASVGLIITAPTLLSGSFLARFFLIILGFAFLVALFHFYDARKFGAAAILKRLDARIPDFSDRYHKQFADTLEEMRISSGLPRVHAYVIPSFAVNSLALIEADGTPGVAVTEGLLADCTRDELQAVSAHELAHIARGDTFYVTLVCSLAGLLDKLRDALEPEDVPAEDRASSGRGGAPPVLVYLTVSFTSVIMHLLSTLLSRERELLADAAAVEISRNPAPLARALYKAHLKSSFVGDFSLTYAPLFIVAPELSSSEAEGFFSRLFNSHPPLMKRIRLLAQMAHLEPAHVIEQVWDSQKTREEAKGKLFSFEELQTAEVPSPGEVKRPEELAQKAWRIQDSDGKWQGPFALDELLFLPYFTAMRAIRNDLEGVDGQAREFPQIRQALKNLGKKKPVDPAQQNRCPRCRTPLVDTFYEGVGILACQSCGGKLVDSAKMERILVRKEFDFSPALLEKARKFRQQFLRNPLKMQRSKEKDIPKLNCPGCGYKMLPRPYTYQYFIPVDKCLSCYKIWFDADELEILQILIEKKV